MKTNEQVNLTPQFHLFTESQIRDVHLATLHVLERTGVRVDEEEAIDLLRGAGAWIRGNGHVRIPPYLVEEALCTAPKTVTLYHRDRKKKIVVEGYRVYFGTGSGCPFTYDLETGQLRRSKKRDTEDFAVLADFLPNIDLVMSMGNCSDFPPESCYRNEFEAMVTHTTKPICFTAEKLEDTKRIYEAAAIVAGGMDQLKAYPFCILYNQPIAPLFQPKETVKKLLYCAENRLPIIYSPAVCAGSTGPTTLAGTLVQGNAEVLSGLVIHQLKAKGAPFVYCLMGTIFDMRTGSLTHGDPGHFLISTARAEMAHSYNLPIFGTGGRTDSKCIDAQAGIEGVLSLFLETLCGANIIHNVGHLSTGLVSSHEMLILVNEMIEMTKRIMSGITVNPETLAEEVIHEVGSRGQYLTHEHTLKHFRREFWIPEFMNRDYLDLWVEKGRPQLTDQLKTKAKSILKQYSAPSIPEEVLKKISKILA